MTVVAAPIVTGLKELLRIGLWTVAPRAMAKRTRRLSPRVAARLDAAPLIFVHIPKTGGISVSHALYGSGNLHWTWHQWRRIDPARFRHYLKFAVVRDPVDRFLSGYDFLVAGGFDQHDAAFADRHVRPLGDVHAFIAAIATDAAFATVIRGWLHFRPQAQFVAQGSNLMVNRLIPFERINDLVPAIIGQPALPRLNVTPGARTPRDALREDDVAFVERHYATDRRLHSFAIEHAAENVYRADFMAGALRHEKSAR